MVFIVLLKCQLNDILARVVCLSNAILVFRRRDKLVGCSDDESETQYGKNVSWTFIDRQVVLVIFSGLSFKFFR